MTITKLKVGYSTSIPIMAYGIKDNAWAEVEVEGDREFKEVWNELKDIVDAAVREKYPHLYTESGKPVTIEQIRDVQIDKEDPIAGHIAAINSASNLAALNWFRTLVEKEGDKYPELRQAFDNKLKQLQ